jgi:hypothetical protein
MKKLIIPVLVLSVYMSSCGPAAEDRKRMDYVARRNSDSIGKWLDSSITDPQRELGIPVSQPGAPPAPADNSKK